MLENIKLSFQGIWAHKMRSFLTMLGIIIGIASIISIVSTIKGTNEQIKQNLIGAGNNTVDITLSQGDSPYEMNYMPIPAGVPVITKDTLDIIREIEEVEKASAYVSRNYADGICYQNTMLEGGRVLGIDEEYLSTCGYQVTEGRGFLERDYSNFQKVVLLDQDAASNLCQDQDAVGKTIEIKGEPFTVVGVIRKSKKFEPVIQSMEDYNMYSQQNAGTVLMPDTCWPIVYQFDEPQNVIVKAVETEAMSQAGKAVEDLLNQSVTAAGEIRYKAADLLERAKNLQDLSESTNRQLIWIASISLLVGGIGVMNIMLVSVTERTKEIGLKRAVGARKRNILIQFLTEAAVLTSIGGVLGVCGGIGMAQIISRLSQTPVAISLPAIGFSVVFSMIIGILFGLLPSVKAANLDPIEALRRE